MRKSARRVTLLTAARLNRFAWLRHGFTTRNPNELNVNYSLAQSPAGVDRNRRMVLRWLGAARRARRWQLVTLRQRHTDVIQVISEGEAALRGSARERDGAMELPGDAVATNRPGLLLAVQVADCLPILLVDPSRRAVAAVHAGWRGTAKRVVEKTVGRLRERFGCDPKQILAAIGPGIHHCCYEVGREVVETFASQFSDWQEVVRCLEPSPSQIHWQQPLHSPIKGEQRPRPAATALAAERFYLDLVEANRRQLRKAGLKASQIWASPLCTACRTDLFFSHRGERGHTGRMMGLIGLVDARKPRTRPAR